MAKITQFRTLQRVICHGRTGRAGSAVAVRRVVCPSNVRMGPQAKAQWRGRVRGARLHHVSVQRGGLLRMGRGPVLVGRGHRRVHVWGLVIVGVLLQLWVRLRLPGEHLQRVARRRKT